MALVSNHRLRSCIAPLAGVFCVLVSSAKCGGTPSCEQAFSNFYAMGCELTVNGGALSLTDVINSCNEAEAAFSAGTCACSDPYDDMLSCFAGIGPDQCSTCATELSTKDACTSSCPGL
jgi:hypothetical protein